MANFFFDSHNYFCHGAWCQDISFSVLLHVPLIMRRGFNYELGCSSLALFARETNSRLTSASLKGAEDLSGELFHLASTFSSLALSLTRGGVLS